ncbi:MAG: heavy-metal-associated domain-containing protein [Bacteroidales bacterium]|nr:heavy-metal-associated domain-containing protein [Bacteroidales bacterium]
MNPQVGQTNSMPGMDTPARSKSECKEPHKKQPLIKPDIDNSMPEMDMPEKLKSDKVNTSISAIQQATFGVSGNCEMCKDRIEKAAISVKGVDTAVWDVDSKKIAVKFYGSETDVNALQKAIALVGHDTEKYKAENDIYDGLPSCCKYRK